jgi:SAM-dependent methyltransferase
MTDVPTYHDQRDRAESFGAVAELYDRYRPSYPDELIDALTALRPANVLDVGCGTGKAARQLAVRGLDVLGVEIDAEMAAVARRRGIDVEVASFEQWADGGRTFDLVVCGQAWHWVDPALGAPKLVRLLRPGGTVCLFWNYDDFDKQFEAVLDDVFGRLAPELKVDTRAGEDAMHERALRETGAFATVEVRDYKWRESLPVDDWVGRMSTYSKQLLLGSQRLAEVQAELRDALRAEFGEILQLTQGTHSLWAQP